MWVDVGDLLHEVAGSFERVLRTDLRMMVATVHNLTVEVDHTYYVLAGDDPVLVHNAGGTCSFSIGKYNYDDQIGRQMKKRGWTPESVEETINHPHRTVETRDRRNTPDGETNDGPATG